MFRGILSTENRNCFNLRLLSVTILKVNLLLSSLKTLAALSRLFPEMCQSFELILYPRFQVLSNCYFKRDLLMRCALVLVHAIAT